MQIFSSQIIFCKRDFAALSGGAERCHPSFHRKITDNTRHRRWNIVHDRGSTRAPKRVGPAWSSLSALSSTNSAEVTHRANMRVCGTFEGDGSIRYLGQSLFQFRLNRIIERLVLWNLR